MTDESAKARSEYWLALFLSHLADRRNCSPETVRAYANDISQFNQHLEALGLPPDEVGHQEGRRYLASLSSRGLSRRSAARKLAALRAYYRYLKSSGKVVDNPFQAIASPKRQLFLPTVMSLREVAKLLGAPDRGTITGLRDAAILELLYATGARVAEIVALRPGDVRRSHVRLFGKGGKERLVPLAVEAWDTVFSYARTSRPRLAAAGERAGRVSDRLFLNTRGTALTDSSVRRMVRAYAARACVSKRVTPHSFRHTFATHLLESGAGLRPVQELLGHVDLSSTQIYTHLSRSGLKQIHSQTHPRA